MVKNIKIREFINMLIMGTIGCLILFNTNITFFKAFGIEIIMITIVSFFYSSGIFYNYLDNPFKYKDYCCHEYYEIDCGITNYFVICNTLLYGVFSLFDNFIVLLFSFGEAKLLTYIIVNFLIIGLFRLWIQIMNH